MKNHFSTFSKLLAATVCALSLGSCGRAEYAMLPKGASYHGVARAATPVRAATPALAVAPAAAPVAEAASVPTTAAVPAQPATVAAANRATETVAPRTSASTPAAIAAATPAPKLNLVQRIAMNKVTRKMDKLMQKAGSVRQHNNTASTARGGISGNLRTGLILLLVGLLIGALGGISYIFGVIGGIIAIIGLIFIILWLLDQA